MIEDVNLLPVRPFSPGQDIPRLLSLCASVEAVDQEGIEISEQILLDQLNLPGHDPVHDRWVIDSPMGNSTLVGSALIMLSPGTQNANANIIVHPDWRHLGV